MSVEASLNSIPKDVAKLVGAYAGNFFPLSSISRKFRGFFQEERQKALKKSKILVKKNVWCSILHTYDGKLYVTGRSCEGQFGIPDVEEFKQWTRIGPKGKTILRVVHNATWNMYVQCEDGWYGAGLNMNFQLDSQSKDDKISAWVKIEGPSKRKKDKVVDLIATDRSIFIRCHNGRWYARGLNDSGQLSPLFRKKSVVNWLRVGPSRKKILNIVACESRTYVQCKEGWYSCGKNEHQGKWINIEPAGKKIKQLKANEYHTVIYCDDENWFGYGQNENGQLGTGNTDICLRWVRLGPAEENIDSVWLGHNRLFLYGKNGLYSCGWDETNIFGGPDIKETCYWRLLEVPGKCIEEFKDNNEALFARCEGEWYGVGYAEDSYFGVGESSPGWTWHHLACKGKTINALVPGSIHAFACTDEGWYFAGRTLEGQSGREEGMEIRAYWTKILSHDEPIEYALERWNLMREDKTPETKRITFSHALKKLYDPEIVKMVEEAGQNISDQPSSDVYIFYDRADYCPTSFNFFLPFDYWEIGDQEFQFADRLREILETENYMCLWKNTNIPRHWKESYSRRVQVSVNNFVKLVEFLKEFETFLDQPKNILLQNLVLNEGAEPERKYAKAGL